MNEIHFRFTKLDDGQIKIDCAIDPEKTKGLTDGWSHMTTVFDECRASFACRDEVLYQFDNNEDWRDTYVDDAAVIDHTLLGDISFTR